MNFNIINVLYNTKRWYFTFNEWFELKNSKKIATRKALINFVLYLNYLLINNFVYIGDDEINFTKLTVIS